MNAVSGTFLPATQSQRRRDARLLLVDQSKQRIEHLSVSDLSGLLDPGDVLVVNDAGTIPASFQGIHQPSGCAVEVRLASNLSPTQDDLSSWLAVVFGEGNVHADLMIVGDSPSNSDDSSGRIFTGRTGDTLTKMIENVLGLKREDVYILIVTCLMHA